MKSIFLLIFTIVLLEKELNAEESFGSQVKSFIFDETYKQDQSFKRHRLEVEAGAAQVLYNKIGNNEVSGALFNASKIDNSINYYTRFSYYFNLDKKNSFKLMAAPFSISGEGNLSDSFEYGGQNFTPGHANYNYKFNSYRATYRRTIFEDEKFTLRLGLTLKIRDASISLSQGNSYNHESNIGFVPLGHINFEYRPLEKLTFIAEGDFAAAPQGRAFDFAFSTRYDFTDYIDLSAGYRLLEGGASNNKVHNFAFINYYFVALGVKF